MSKEREAERLSVGQKLWFVPSHSRYGCSEVTVTSVGRKWAKLSNHHRIDMHDMSADGGQYNSPGRAYLSKEVYDAEVWQQELWSRFRQLVDRHWRTELSSEQILVAAKALGFDIELKEAT